MNAQALALALTIGLSAPAFDDAVSTPTDFGKLFCAASLADDMSTIADKMTPGLALVVAEAVAKNTQAQVSFPDDKPPLGDGLPWRSYPDFADGCDIGEATEAKPEGTTMVEIRYSFAEWPDANYVDQLVLVPSINEPGSWELDDIALRDGATMRSILAEAFEAPPTE